MQQSQKKQNTPEEVPVSHWADHVADELIAKHPGEKRFVCASGISPSGVVHIGNFREVVTVEFVVRALLDRGKDVRFIYSWDDYDAFRKVPANLPNQELLTQNLRKPLALIPDPYGDCDSYSSHFEKLFENEIKQLGITPEYIYQNKQYQSCVYADGIRHALANEKTIRAILDGARTENLPDDWTALSIFCQECKRDSTKLISYEAPNTVKYTCKACKKDLVCDLEKTGNVKLLWRVDWPMRWAKEGVQFEPGGKDHSSQGGSYDTGKEIIRQVWHKEPPHYVQYDFVLAKGIGSKLSSSSGNLITLSEALEIYEPAVVRWIFASRKPNLDFTIAFDLDVMKAYDDFDRSERYAYGVEPGEDKKVNYERRIYEFATIKRRGGAAYGKMPAQFPFRHLTSILQINQGDLAKTREYYSDQIKTPEDEARFTSRATRAWKWIAEYAPEEFKFQLRPDGAEIPKTKFPVVTKLVVDYLGTIKPGITEDEVANGMYQFMKANNVQPKLFFQDMYEILIGKNNGPKLASFVLAIGPDKARKILERSL